MEKKVNIKEWLARIFLILIGISVAVGIVFLVAPRFIKAGNLRFSNVDLGEVEYSVGTGDLFLVQPGMIAPPENPYEVLSRHRLGWDEDGFRIPARQSDVYPIVALGDSYTEATNVARPWTDVLARELNTPVRNLGFRGWGPQEEAIVFEEYGVHENPEIVIIGFFGGNDVSNAGSFEGREDSFVLPELLEDLTVRFDPSSEPWKTDNTEFQYPVTLQLNESTQVPMVFFNSYISWLNITQDDLRQSKNLEEIVESWRDVRNLANPETCVVIAFLPSKEQIYLPYIIPEQRSLITGGMNQRTIEEPGDTFSSEEIVPTWEELMSRRDNMRLVLAETAEVEGFPFIDVSSVFAETAMSGEVLYYTYDTHWNQAGHNLAGEVIAEFLEAGGCD